MIEEAEAVFRNWKESPDLTRSRPWPYRPAPWPDELLSSWFLRVAHGLTLKPYTLAHATWRSVPPLLTRDIDNMADPRIVGVMAAKVDVPVQRAWETTLAAYDGKLVERYAPGGRNAWILQVGVRHRVRGLGGLQYCPVCFTEHVYFRRAWRVGFVTTCPDHGLRLLDRCDQCGSTLEPHRSAALHLCPRCGLDLRQGSLIPASRRVIELQRRAQSVLARGWGHLGGQILGWSHLYFDTLRIVVKALSFGVRSQALRNAVARRHGGDPSSFPKGAKTSIEQMCVGDRHRVLDLAAPLMKAWPERLVEACQEARMWRSWILHDAHDPPFVIADVINEHLTLRFYKPSTQEIVAALAYLQGTGRPVLKADLMRLVGDCQEVNAIFQAHAIR
ncbi:hypothetical protein CFHF_03750 [Caulobacter flavus]|uniref:TniQ domain-containing protein n=1 Tax=Caulobacter flavus TaxID=1679497 RepID=A0A2N5CZ94_9CAUL|nr:TniQ family protein [Caulobacter flavus]AYV45187.1 hypothetical protein C1707_02420 [Caulobacter flavus]PLR19133.1 hypothetical protein CFHF_03750 [Caulobacter flavus]